jgi:uncharacterized repeat protein (TIGR03803 family)
MTPTGKLTTLYSFCSLGSCTDGGIPIAGLVQATNGDLYGTTSEGGANNWGPVFKITPRGTLTRLLFFDLTDGANPFAGLVQAINGDFYGTTSYGGAYIKYGTVFKITLKGTLTSLYGFAGYPTDGAEPYAGLVQGTNGDFYGTTVLGGANCGTSGCGTVFSLSVGLGPFVKTQTISGRVGAAVKILGTDLTGATSVSFNGTPVASFTVNSSGSAISTKVPVGATTGFVTVNTPTGTLKSNVKFRVLP